MTEEIVNLYDCDVCGFRYDPEEFSNLDLDAQPSSFECPQCQAGKDHFHVFTPPSDDVAPILGDDAEDGRYSGSLGPPADVHQSKFS